MPRREFSKSVKVEIVKRATRSGVVYCEECGCLTKRWEIDHVDADALQIDKSRSLTADDGKLLCIECHKEKTAHDVAIIAKAKRNEANHLGIKVVPVRKIPQGPKVRSERTARRIPKPPLAMPSEIQRRFMSEE